jgi:diguanylate cyclase (GGDEF)-like protein
MGFMIATASGRDTIEQAGGGGDPLLAGVRRLTALADRAGAPEAIFGGLARELFSLLGAEEVHVHHLCGSDDGGGDEDSVVVYLFEGEGRLSYLVPRGERAPGVSWVTSTGRSFLAAEAQELAASVPRLVETATPSCALLLPVAVRAEVEAVVILVRSGPEVFTERSVEVATTLVDQGATALALMRARAEAGTDPVTGAMNHRAMRRRLDEEIVRAGRINGRLACLLIDLDNFKLVNDRHGHQAGDAVLREAVQTLVGEFRAFDRVARYGGDEFVVILPNADVESAVAAGVRALERLRSMPSFAGAAGVSASIGVAQWQAPMSTDMLLKACDNALLRSKREGKGRVTRANLPAAH